MNEKKVTITKYVSTGKFASLELTHYHKILMTKQSGLQNQKLIIQLRARKFEILNSKQNKMLTKDGKLLMELIVSVIVIDWVENVIGVVAMDTVVHIQNINGMEIVLNQC